MTDVTGIRQTQESNQIQENPIRETSSRHRASTLGKR